MKRGLLLFAFFAIVVSSCQSQLNELKEKIDYIENTSIVSIQKAIALLELSNSETLSLIDELHSLSDEVKTEFRTKFSAIRDEIDAVKKNIDDILNGFYDATEIDAIIEKVNLSISKLESDFHILYQELNSRINAKVCDGKKVILFGDSQLGQARDYPNEETNMSVLLQDIVGGKVYNWGFGGCSMALREIPSIWDAFCMVSLADAIVSRDFSKQESAAVSLKSDLPYATTILNEMKAESLEDGRDVIICIAYGGNDYNNLCKIGEADSDDKTTYKGAINYSVGKLLTAFPKAKICLIGVAYGVISYTSKTTEGIILDSDSAYNIVVENGSNHHYYRYTYNNALLEQAKYLHVAGYDKYYRAGRNKYNIWELCPNDGIHPESLAGRTAEAEFYARVLSAW